MQLRHHCLIEVDCSYFNLSIISKCNIPGAEINMVAAGTTLLIMITSIYQN